MSTVRCEIITRSLDKPPAYTAVSYAWGDTDDKDEIEVLYGVREEDGRIAWKVATVRVTISLYGALAALRRQEQDVLVWIDGLSINQDDTVERSQQVRLMTEIYGKAATVAVWLGPEANNSNTALHILTKIAHAADSTEHVADLIASYAADDNPSGRRAIASLVALFERDYWSRLWVVQEIFIPDPRKIRVYCGEYRHAWSTYQVAARALLRCRKDIERYFPGNKNHDRYGRISRQHFTFSQVLAFQGPNSLFDGSLRDTEHLKLLGIMRWCRQKLTGNPLDKVFGILGLLPDEAYANFPVDYSMSIKALYIRVVDIVLSTTGCLDVICESIHFPIYTGASDLPSWCPNWFHMPTTRALRGTSPKFSASGNLKAEYLFVGRLRTKLEFRAVYLGYVAEHGVAVGTLTSRVDFLTAFLSWRALFRDKIRPEDYDDCIVLASNFCRTLCLDQIPRGYDPSTWWQVCYHVFGALSIDPEDGLPMLPLDAELLRYAETDGIMHPDDRRPFLNTFNNHMSGRRFCILGNYRTMALGSGFLQMGDIVVVPLGCSTPVVLREEGPEGEFRFVGDIYVDGYMEGRAIDLYKRYPDCLRKYLLH
ncbi:hypothetical protein E8E12_011473 [Didymella heteroderae]|uniref:Heterokaryon incompatibility domain-containing protein n=1 Tax=Didymella heteroderae TaxID=1769908 RepID=A0A9P5C7K9_9PLEO|nr:hypothetical protein E8E12_011473 [Didymella heteroderae]